MRTILDVYGNAVQISASHVFVSATDKFLSGWGNAEGKTHKQVIICDGWEQAEKIAHNMQGNGYKYVNTCVRLPKYPTSAYTTSYRLASACPALLK